MHTLFYQVIRPTLRGVGQVALINNAITGLLLLVALIIQDLTHHNMLDLPWVRLQNSLTLSTLVGALSSLLMARILSVDTKAIDQGIYGYNGALVGIACATFFTPNSALLVWIVLGGAVTSVIMHLWRWRISPFTFPFLTVIAVIFYTATWLGLTLKGGPIIVESARISSTTPQAAVSIINGVGQVLFQQGVVFSAVVIFAIAAHSIKTALWAVVGATIGLIIASVLPLAFGEFLSGLFVQQHEQHMINASQGLFGFNGALIALALCQSAAIAKRTIIVGVALASIIAWLGIQLGLALLTLPFVLSAWIMLALVYFTNTAKVAQKARSNKDSQGKATH
ncbi:urea transporter [uncultured Vibrio sp.]|uniref:urea transporter n=1 Tax=uncultured Vibrio sp. TaxID=114054 RepID=UPI0025E7797D|nr:urea transporter [uncultured Vibrio sp.]